MSVAEIFDQLNIAQSKNSFGKVYDLSKTLLSKRNDEFEPELYNKIVIHAIENDKYHMALRLVDNLKKAKKSTDSLYLIFETLYVYYKLNKDLEFSQLVAAIDIDSVSSKVLQRALKHLVSQQEYKLGNYGSSLKIYKELMQSDLRSFDSLDLLVNETAILSQTGETEVIDQDQSSYDLLFNNALIKFNGGSEESLEYLKQTQEKIEAAYANESLVDLLIEVAPVYLQTAYIYQALEQKDAALKVLDEFHSKFEKVLNDGDKTVQLFKLIYLNNYYSLTGGASLSVLTDVKYSQLVESIKNENKILTFQYNALRRNESILDFEVGKNVSIRDTGDLTILGLRSLQDSKILLLEDLNTDAEVVNVRLPGLFYKYLRKTLAVKPGPKEIGGVLLAIQLLINSSTEENLNSNLNKGIELIEKIIETVLEHQNFGILILLVNLYQVTLSTSKYQLRLTNLFETVYDKIVVVESQPKFNFLKYIGFEYLSISPSETKVATLFERLLNYNDLDNLVNNMLAKLNQGLASHHDLKPVDEITAGLDYHKLVGEELEQILKDYGGKSTSSLTRNVAKRIRKKPQHANKRSLESKPIDKERWLPLRDRSYYKISKKDKKKLKLSQASTQGGNADHSTEESGISGSAPPAPAVGKKVKKKKGKKGK